MPQRLALAVASVVATIVLVFGLAAAGFGAPSATDGSADAVSADATDAALEPEIVYIKPAPSPKTIVLKKKARAAKAANAANKSGTNTVEREREDRDDDASERREKKREAAEERRKKAAERAKEQREEREEREEREDDD